jgi:hypothetical protein
MAASCTSRGIAASTPSIQGHAHNGAPHARTSALMTSTRNHEAARRRLPLSLAALGAALSTSRPPLRG